MAAYEPPLITAERPTLPGLLRQRGYHTASIGKWHLGWVWPGPQPSRMMEKRHGLAALRWDFDREIRGGPIDRGFDSHFGVDLPNFPPFTFIENDRVVAPPIAPFRPDPVEGSFLPTQFAGAPAPAGWRLQDILPQLTTLAVRHVQDRARARRPFFRYFSLTFPHNPVVPSEALRGKSGVAPIADFIIETDWAMGQVVKAIDKAGLAEDTIVVFTADNGHARHTGWEQLVAAGLHPSGPLRGHKGDIREGGHRCSAGVPLAGPRRARKLERRTGVPNDWFATVAAIVGTEPPAGG